MCARGKNVIQMANMSRGCNEKKNNKLGTSLVATNQDFKKSYTWHTEPKVIHVFKTTLRFE